MHVITLQYRRYFGSFRHLPQERHYAFHIYIGLRLNTWQTFINYELMKCSAVLGDEANEDVDFLCSLTRWARLIPSSHHALLSIITLVSVCS